ncbi:hypothetical protein IAQ61_008319 [Plenodomus lingam]|uniref:uncharacterized protein n=1 Tax=Leptosphaeria maculans TaxID=5022 RepID=UPI00331E93E5|nr:hypothetical protein IAQ61_008319 [Plenodomus lingam]
MSEHVSKVVPLLVLGLWVHETPPKNLYPHFESKDGRRREKDFRLVPGPQVLRSAILIESALSENFGMNPGLRTTAARGSIAAADNPWAERRMREIWLAFILSIGWNR